VTTQRKSVTNLDKSFTSVTNKSVISRSKQEGAIVYQKKPVLKQTSRNLTPGKWLATAEKSVTKKESMKQLTKQKTITNFNDRMLKTQKSGLITRKGSKERGASEDTLKKSNGYY
jgi:hypothetical protein